MIEISSKDDTRRLGAANRAAFISGFRDGLASVMFPASAGKVTVHFGSRRDDMRRVTFEKALMRARFKRLRLKRLSPYAAALAKELEQAVRD